MMPFYLSGRLALHSNRCGRRMRNAVAHQFGSGFHDPNAGGPVGSGFDPEGLLKSTPMGANLIEKNLAKRDLDAKRKEAA